MAWRIAIACLAASTISPALALGGLGGVGDPYFPKAGNGGYDARGYRLVLDYDPATDVLTGKTRIRARARRNLERFHLDYLGPEITSLKVRGRPAEFERNGQELVVEPRRTVTAGRRFRTVVAYAGVPETVTDPDGSTEGWTTTADGSAALGEPIGSPAWFPSNNHPTDKATYRFRVTVPEPLVALANGTLEERSSAGGGKTLFVWRERDPMASYLAVLATGAFALEEGSTAGIPSWIAIDPTQAAATDLAAMPEMHEFLASRFGPYPFESTGAIVDLNPTLGYALETQTKPYYSLAPGESTVVHEIAHQWYGNSVTLGGWNEIWLNEGFATYAEWLWEEAQGGETTAQRFDDLYATPASDNAFWNPPPGDPGPAGIFDGTVYTRGAMTLQALREKIGDADFFELLPTYHERFEGSYATTPRLLRVAERVSGEQLDALFRKWLYAEGKPGA